MLEEEGESFQIITEGQDTTSELQGEIFSTVRVEEPRYLERQGPHERKHLRFHQEPALDRSSTDL